MGAVTVSPNTLPTPKPMIPDMIPCSRSPVSAHVPIPLPIAPAKAEDMPVVAAAPAAVAAVAPAPVRNVLPNKLPNNAPMNISGCPVSGLIVIGIPDAIPCTSFGLTCMSIVSP